jgi:transketolase
MRKSFFESLTDNAVVDNEVIFLTADLGFGFVEDFIKKCPSQFINVGVSEQAMLGLANGLAISGKKVICYSIAAFSLVRPFEFFRNGAIAQNSAVMVVGVGPGFDYSQDGLSHYCLEDLAMMQSQPEVNIQTPFTQQAVKESVQKFVLNPEPTYLRLPRNLDKNTIMNLEITEPEAVDVLIICTALMGKRANQISQKLTEEGLKVVIGSTNELSVKSDAKLVEHLKLAKKALVVEDHYEFGGLGTRVGELVSTNKLGIEVMKDGVIKVPRGTIGDFTYMENKLMKNAQDIIAILKKS